MSVETKRYYAVSDGNMVLWIETEAEVLEVLTSRECDLEAARVLTTDVPDWQTLDEDAEEQLLNTARDRRAKREAERDRVRRVAFAIANRRYPGRDIDSLPPSVQSDLYAEARDVLAVVDGPVTGGEVDA